MFLKSLFLVPFVESRLSTVTRGKKLQGTKLAQSFERLTELPPSKQARAYDY
jgi:hypothetical protein